MKFSFAKDIANGKKETVEGMKIFGKHISNEKLLPRIYKELSKLRKKKKNPSFSKWAKNFYKYIT